MDEHHGCAVPLVDLLDALFVSRFRHAALLRSLLCLTSVGPKGGPGCIALAFHSFWRSARPHEQGSTSSGLEHLDPDSTSALDSPRVQDTIASTGRSQALADLVTA